MYNVDFVNLYNVYPYVGQHHITIAYCSCHNKLERLIQLRLWPATPTSPKLAFTFDLMELLHILILECQVSLHDAARMLKTMAVVQQKQVLFCIICVTLCL